MKDGYKTASQKYHFRLLFLLGIFLTSTFSLSDSIPTGNIDCTDLTSTVCQPDFQVKSIRQGSGYHAIDVGENSSNVNVFVQNGQKPRDLKLSITNGSFPDGELTPGFNLTVNLSSTTKDANSGNFVLIGDNFKKIDLKLNGFGQIGQDLNGKDASKICAENIKSSRYGADALSIFNNLRNNNPSLPQDRCTQDDINSLQATKFKCDSGFSEIITTNSIYSVNVQRVLKMPRCQTSLTYDVCVRKKVQVTCDWAIFRQDGTKTDFGATVYRVMPENQYYYYRNMLSDADICNLHVAQEVTDPFYVPQGKSAVITGNTRQNQYQITSAFTFKGNIQANSNIVEFSHIPTWIAVGQSIVGAGIAPNTTIVSIKTNSLILSTNATVTDSDVLFLTDLSVGQSITGPGILPNTVITEISPALIKLNNQIASDSTEQQFSALIQSTTANPLKDDANIKAGCAIGNPCSWKVIGLSSTLTTPGLDGDRLASGSDWNLSNTNLNEHCDSSNNVQTGFWSTLKTVNINYVAYDPVDSKCKAQDVVTYTGGVKNSDYPAKAVDPNMSAVWFYTGMAQESDFGTEVIQCDLGNCPVNSVVSDLTQTLDTITPEDGLDATQQGKGLIFVYDYQSIVSESKIGTAGSGGRNDLINQSTRRVCAKIRDANSDGINSSYAKDPLVVFSRYNWTAIKTNASGNPGRQPPNNGNSIEIWKKVDPSVRYFLQDKLFTE